MAVIERKRGEFHLNFRPFKTKTIGVKLPLDVTGKKEAKRIEQHVLDACRSGDYRALTPMERAVCINMFDNQKWQIPRDLRTDDEPRSELTFWETCALFLRSPAIVNYRYRWRHEIALNNLAEKLGEDTPLRDIDWHRLESYRTARLAEGKVPGTVNREISTFSKLFTTMRKLKQVEGVNPASELEPRTLSTEDREREVYLSLPHVERIAAKCPIWFRPIVWTAFYAGMREGEIVGLERHQIDLAERMIYLGAGGTKEGHKKRVPIHRDLAPILEQVLDAPPLLGEDRIFLVRDSDGVRITRKDTVKNPWPRAVEALGIFQDSPGEPRFHDLRHTFVINAAESGVPEPIIDMITGHAGRKKSVHELYRGRPTYRFLRDAVDTVTFDHGETRIVVGGIPYPLKNDNWMTTGSTQRQDEALDKSEESL